MSTKDMEMTTILFFSFNKLKSRCVLSHTIAAVNTLRISLTLSFFAKGFFVIDILFGINWLFEVSVSS